MGAGADLTKWFYLCDSESCICLKKWFLNPIPASGCLLPSIGVLLVCLAPPNLPALHTDITGPCSALSVRHLSLPPKAFGNTVLVPLTPPASTGHLQLLVQQHDVLVVSHIQSLLSFLSAFVYTLPFPPDQCLLLLADSAPRAQWHPLHSHLSAP